MNQCHICLFRANNKKSLGLHFKIHKDYIKMAMEMSRQYFKSGLSIDAIYDKLLVEINYPFDKSIIRKYLDIKNYICPCCDNGFLTRQARHSHIFRLSKRDLDHSNLYNEQLCIIERFSDKLDLLEKEKSYILDLDFPRFHLRKTNINKFKCPVCSLGFKDDFSLRLHIKTYIEKNISKEHSQFIDKELKKIDNYILRGIKYEALYSKTLLPRNFVAKYFRDKTANKKCPVCNMVFYDNSGLGNHLKIHPEFLDKLKNKVIDLFYSNLTANDIRREENICFSAGWIGQVWLDEFGQQNVKKRTCRISYISIMKQFANGKRFKSKNRRDIQFLDNTERYEFRTNRKKILYLCGSKCVACGKDNSKHVHHIIPLRLSRNNMLGNLICLCSNCHGKVHAAPRRLEMKMNNFDDICDLYIDSLDKLKKECSNA